MKLITTILCGGAGSRLWPVSRELHPKPFIRLADGQSLLQKAFLRGSQLKNCAEIFTVTNRDLFFKAKDEFAEINDSDIQNSFILEPFGRNTAAAITSAAIEIERKYGSNAVMLVLAADHLIGDSQSFQLAVMDAINLAQEGKLVTFGIKPDGPETGFGYIEFEGNLVLNFIEKPSFEKAQHYIESGRYLWNSGMFCFTAGTLLKQMERYSPEVLSTTKLCIESSNVLGGNGLCQIELDLKTFRDIPDISIDYALMEPSDQVAVVPCDIGWSDIGSWTALSALNDPDMYGNRVQGDSLLQDSSNCAIFGNDRLISAVGVDNLIIVDTEDAVLVLNKAHAQDVKKVYAELKLRGHVTHKQHRTMHRPWGTYSVLEEESRYKIKRIEVKPNASLSLQMHHHRSEHWIVVSGIAKIINGEREFLLNTNESTYIPAGHRHRLENPGMIKLVMIEVQSGEYLGEDDIVRFVDNYGRS